MAAIAAAADHWWSAVTSHTALFRSSLVSPHRSGSTAAEETICGGLVKNFASECDQWWQKAHWPSKINTGGVDAALTLSC